MNRQQIKRAKQLHRKQQSRQWKVEQRKKTKRHALEQMNVDQMYDFLLSRIEIAVKAEDFSKVGSEIENILLLSMGLLKLKSEINLKPTVWVVSSRRTSKRTRKNSQYHRAILSYVQSAGKNKIIVKKITDGQLGAKLKKIKKWDIVILPYDYTDINRNKKSSLYAQLAVKIDQGRILNYQAIMERSNDKGVGSKRGFAKFAKENNLPVPRTWLAEDWLKLKRKPKLEEYIVKKSLGSLGNEVHLCKTREEVNDILSFYGSENCLIQEKITTAPPVFDIRIWISNGNFIGAIKRIIKKGVYDFRTNLSGGRAYAEKYDPTEEELNICMKAFKATGLDFVAFDLMKSKSGEIVFIEANITAGMRHTAKVLKHIRTKFASSLISGSVEMMMMEVELEETPSHTPSWKKG